MIAFLGESSISSANSKYFIFNVFIVSQKLFYSFVVLPVVFTIFSVGN